MSRASKASEEGFEEAVLGGAEWRETFLMSLNMHP